MIASGLFNIIQRSYHISFKLHLLHCGRKFHLSSEWPKSSRNALEVCYLITINLQRFQDFNTSAALYTFNVPGFMYQFLDCTRFSFTSFFVFFEMYQVSKYQVFQESIRFKVPGWRKYQVKSTRTWYFFVQPGKKKTYDVLCGWTLTANLLIPQISCYQLPSPLGHFWSPKKGGGLSVISGPSEFFG